MAHDHAPDDDEGPHLYFEQFGSIPIVDRIDPAVQAQRKADADIAGAFHTPEELQAGMHHLVPGHLVDPVHHIDRLDVVQAGRGLEDQEVTSVSENDRVLHAQRCPSNVKIPTTMNAAPTAK